MIREDTCPICGYPGLLIMQSPIALSEPAVLDEPVTIDRVCPTPGNAAVVHPVSETEEE